MKECNCGNYKPYIETMEVGVIHAPAMPFNACVNCYGEEMKEITLYREDNGQYSTSEAKQDDVSGVYVQKEHLTDLQAQSDELRAHASMLKTALVLCSAQHKEHYIGQAVVDAALEASPAQTLADIRAEAVNGFIDAFRYEFEGPTDTDSIEAFAEQYANKIKGAE